MKDREPTLADKMTTEADLEKAIEDVAHAYGWLRVHFRGAWTGKGFRTPVAGDGAGFPDNIYVKPDEPITIIECKTEKGKLTQGYWKGEGRRRHYVMGQADWIEILKRVPGIRVMVLRPRHIDDLPMLFKPAEVEEIKKQEAQNDREIPPEKPKYSGLSLDLNEYSQWITPDGKVL